MREGVDPKPSLQGITVSGGRLNVYNSVLLIQNLTGYGNISGVIPQRYNLYQNYPNPFNPSTIIRYDLPKNEFVSLKIYNALGQEIVSLVNKVQDAGIHELPWNANDFSSGIYFYKLVAGEYSSTRKMMLIK